MPIIKTPVDIDGRFEADSGLPAHVLNRFGASAEFMIMQEGFLFVRAIRLYDESGEAVEDGRWIRIRMLDIKPTREANNRIGVAGLRYRCVALREVRDSGEPIERPFSLWREKDKFYVEKEEWFHGA